MTASVHLDAGNGPGIVLRHGVGAGPETLTERVGLPHDQHRCVVVERPGGGGGAIASLDAREALTAPAPDQET